MTCWPRQHDRAYCRRVEGRPVAMPSSMFNMRVSGQSPVQVGALRCSGAQESRLHLHAFTQQLPRALAATQIPQSRTITASPAAAGAPSPLPPGPARASRRRRGSGEGESELSADRAPTTNGGVSRGLRTGCKPCCALARAPPAGARRTGKRSMPGTAGRARRALRGRCTGVQAHAFRDGLRVATPSRRFGAACRARPPRCAALCVDFALGCRHLQTIILRVTGLVAHHLDLTAVQMTQPCCITAVLGCINFGHYYL